MENVTERLSKSMLPHSPDSFELRYGRCGTFSLRGKLCCSYKSCNRLRGRGAEQDVGGTSVTSGTSGTNKQDKSDKGESNNKGSAVGNIESSEASD